METLPFTSPSWARALTLSERIAILISNNDKQPLPASRSNGAQSRIQRWRAEPQFVSESIFDRRLASDGIDQDTLAHILGIPAEVLKQHSEKYGWLEWLEESFSQPASAFANPPAGSEELCFLDLIQPLIDLACDQLFAGVEQIRTKFPNPPFDQQTIEDILLPNLPGPLLTRLSRTLVLELNVARIQGQLSGETPGERFESFIERIRQPEQAISILSEYPVLARQLVICLNQWVDASLEFLDRLSSDWPEICKIFFHGEDPGLLVEVAAGAGDTHRGGRSVIIAQFESGFRLVYKPKSLAIDKHFQELLAWLNERGCQPHFRILDLLDCGSYGWVEFIVRKECHDMEEVKRFYRRLGAYLGLLYAINASDFHLENLIAAGEQPLLIDLETLFNPEFERFETNDASAGAARAMLNSALVVGMLPQRLWSAVEYSGVDISGFGGESGQLSPDRVPLPDALGTDEMRYVRQRLEMAGEANRPLLNGREINALDHIPEIIDGFRAMYHLLLRHRHDLLADGGPISWFSDDETRVLLRPTRTYDQLLFESFHPDVLRDALQRDLHFDRLWLVVPERPHMGEAVPIEQHDLRQGDIPIFTSRPTSLTLWSAAGTPINGILLQDGMSIARQRINNLSHPELKRQEWFIHSSLATLATFDHVVTTSATVSDRQIPKGGRLHRERLLNGVRSVGDKLVDSAIHGQNDVIWISLEHLADGIWDLGPSGVDLYNGLAGISLFLAYAGAVLQEDKYESLARKSTVGILDYIESFSPELPEIGAFTGWGGLLYTLSHLAKLWDDQDLLRSAEALVATIAQLTPEDENHAIFDGSAGALRSLLAFYDMTESSTAMKAAIACGDHLLASAVTLKTGIGWLIPGQGSKPLTGYAYGAAGIASALLYLAKLSGEKRFLEAASQALTYERNLFSTQKQNWPDLRQNTQQEEERSYPIAWCHGAVGIGLSRLEALYQLDDDVLSSEVQAAVQTTLNHGFGQNHSLCHGDMGHLELLHMAQLLDGCSHKQLDIFGGRVLDSIDRDGWKCGGPMAVEMPGLMLGIAGIGYQMLRLAEPLRVPSVLLLDPPTK